MVVIGLEGRAISRRLFCAIGITYSLLAKPPRTKRKPETDELREVLTYLCSALANGNADDAMTVFSKSFPDYLKLADRFSALSGSFDIASEVEVTDENQESNDAELIGHWALTLTDRATGESKRKARDVTVRFRRDASGKWRIVSFQSADLFSP